MTTEAKLLANILEWLADSPNCQRYALPQLTTQAVLKLDELDELVSISKG